MKSQQSKGIFVAIIPPQEKGLVCLEFLGTQEGIGSIRSRDLYNVVSSRGAGESEALGSTVTLESMLKKHYRTIVEGKCGPNFAFEVDGSPYVCDICELI